MVGQLMRRSELRRLHLRQTIRIHCTESTCSSACAHPQDILTDMGVKLPVKQIEVTE